MTRTPRKSLSSAAAVDHATLLAAAPGRPDRDACRKVLAQVYKVVAAVLGPRSADVADVTQDAFMRVHRAIPRFAFDPEKPAGATAWINTIALRTALDHRADTASREALEPDMDRTAFVETDVDPTSIDRAILAAALLTKLDERHRAILILAYWNGETQEEIAETLSLPIGTVKTRMRAAHQRLREHLSAHAAAEPLSPAEEDT
ncbi:MAG: sigma-70 family RNA polymerase sigma factor [Polyangiaceae bacterium]